MDEKAIKAIEAILKRGNDAEKQQVSFNVYGEGQHMQPVFNFEMQFHYWDSSIHLI